MNFKYDSSYASEHRPPNSSPGNDRVPGSVSLETFPLYRETKTEREREGGGEFSTLREFIFPLWIIISMGFCARWPGNFLDRVEGSLLTVFRLDNYRLDYYSASRLCVSVSYLMFHRSLGSLTSDRWNLDKINSCDSSKLNSGIKVKLTGLYLRETRRLGNLSSASIIRFFQSLRLNSFRPGVEN